MDDEQWLMDEYYSPEDEIEDEEQEEEMDESQEILDVNKRTPSAQQAGRAFFPSHLRSAFYGSGQRLPSSITMHRRPVAAAVAAKPHTLHQQQTNDLALGKRLPVYNFGLGK